MRCSTCALINVASYFVEEINVHHTESNTIEASPDAFRLGSLLEVYARYSQCNFCQLVFDAITHHAARVAWRSPEWLLRQSRKLGSEGQCVIYSYRFASSEDSQKGDVLLAHKAGYRIAIALWPKEAWDGSMAKAGELALTEDGIEEYQDPPLFSGRQINPNRVDVGLARRWLQICKTQHGDTCEIPAHDAKTAIPDSHPQKLIVIDVQDLKLCPLPEEASYIALSYCWPCGAESTFRTTKAVYKELLRPGALASRLESLTAVVRDTISFVREFGERFLWVDALCIVQDDLEYKMDQIRQMDLVYGAALMTIICADPQDRVHQDSKFVKHRPAKEIHPGLGLTGYRSGSRLCPQIRAKVDDLVLQVPFTAVDVAFDYSRWTTRAWTFQEYVLARRKLYFTDLQLYYQCSCAIYAEDTAGEDQSPHSFNHPFTTLWNSGDTRASMNYQTEFAWVSRSPPKGPLEAIQTYRMLQLQYSERQMTNPGDVLFAFQGVFAVLRRTLQTEFIAGLPEKYFHEALLWVGIGEFLLRSIKAKDGAKMLPYPSWTWAGWMQRSIYNLVFAALSIGDEDSFLVGEAKWFITNRKSLWPLSTPSMHERTREKWGNRTSDLGAGPLPPDLENMLKPRHELKLDNDFWNPSLNLMSWTNMARFRITGDSYRLEPYGGTAFLKCRNTIIFDRNGNEAGSIILRQEALDHLLDEGNIHDFLLLSRSFQLTRYMKFFDEAVFPRRDWCYMSVMLIAEGSKRGTGNAGRFGVGVIHEDAWVASRPQPNYVMLQ